MIVEKGTHTVIVSVLVVIGALLLAVLGLLLVLAILLVGHRGALGVNLLLGGILRRKVWSGGSEDNGEKSITLTMKVVSLCLMSMT